MGVDFGSVNFRILSPDGKTVLAELQSIDKAGQRLEGTAERITPHFNKAANASRQIGFALSSANGDLKGAVGAAGSLAEQLAIASGNAKLITAAAGIGAIVSLGLFIRQLWTEANRQMEDFIQKSNQIGSDIRVAQLSGIDLAHDYAAKREQILATGQKELDQSKQIQNEEERKAYQLQVNKRTREQLAASAREEAQAQRDIRMAAAATLLSLQDANRILEAQTHFAEGSREQRESVGRVQLGADRNQRINAAQALHEKGKLTTQQLNDQLAEINRNYDLAVAALTQSLDKATADATNDANSDILTIGGSRASKHAADIAHIQLEAQKKAAAGVAPDIVDAWKETALAGLQTDVWEGPVNNFANSLHGAVETGIEKAFERGANIGQAFDAFKDAALQGLGGVFSELGEQYLEYGSIMQALSALLPDPFTAGPASIAIGVALIALGASLGAVAKRHASGSHSAGPGAANTPGMTYLGVINAPYNVPGAGAIGGTPVRAPSAININNPIFVGERDPAWQRSLLATLKYAGERGGV
jgi:hypothetical protein